MSDSGVTMVAPGQEPCQETTWSPDAQIPKDPGEAKVRLLSVRMCIAPLAALRLVSPIHCARSGDADPPFLLSAPIRT